jgi:hypothetical protein
MPATNTIRSFPALATTLLAALAFPPPVATFDVQPGHRFVLGDNSPESSDSRFWGLVPQGHLLGRAFFRYFPLGRVGLLR